MNPASQAEKGQSPRDRMEMEAEERRESKAREDEAAAGSAERRRMTTTEEWPLDLETAAWIGQRGWSQRVGRAVEKGRTLPGWGRAPGSCSEAVWRQHREAKCDGKKSLSCLSPRLGRGPGRPHKDYF